LRLKEDGKSWYRRRVDIGDSLPFPSTVAATQGYWPNWTNGWPYRLINDRTSPIYRALMNIEHIPFGITEWSAISPTEHKGETGVAFWRTCQFGAIRVRMVEYSAGYFADHWCSKGHILLCLEGELHTELEDGRRFILKPGMSYQVADNAEAHRSYAPDGAKLFVVD
jgi:quercetin dioxygenase-like cupin family protein